jgi:hypothetical protein
MRPDRQGFSEEEEGNARCVELNQASIFTSFLFDGHVGALGRQYAGYNASIIILSAHREVHAGTTPSRGAASVQWLPLWAQFGHSYVLVAFPATS